MTAADDLAQALIDTAPPGKEGRAECALYTLEYQQDPAGPGFTGIARVEVLFDNGDIVECRWSGPFQLEAMTDPRGVENARVLVEFSGSVPIITGTIYPRTGNS